VKSQPEEAAESQRAEEVRRKQEAEEKERIHKTYQQKIETLEEAHAKNLRSTVKELQGRSTV